MNSTKMLIFDTVARSPSFAALQCAPPWFAAGVPAAAASPRRSIGKSTRDRSRAAVGVEAESTVEGVSAIASPRYGQVFQFLFLFGALRGFSKLLWTFLQFLRTFAGKGLGLLGAFDDFWKLVS